MTWKLGYAVGSLIFLAFFAVALAAQVASKKYHPFVYWAVVVATTTVGTTMSDYFDRTLGLGYVKSSVYSSASSSPSSSPGTASWGDLSSRTSPTGGMRSSTG
jgi:uncharacterized membrane-anchored protein